MKARKLFSLFGALAFVGMLASCSSTGYVASTDFSARKYNPGHFNNKPGAYTTPASVATAPAVTPSATAFAAAPVAATAQPAENVQQVTVAAAPQATTGNIENTDNNDVLPVHKSKLAKAINNFKVAHGMKVTNDVTAAAEDNITNANSVQSSRSSSGGGWDWKHHKVKWILCGLLLVLIIVIFVATGGQGYNSRGN